MKKKLFACDACHFLFEAVVHPEQCPDYGKYKVREASDSEISEYEKRRLEADDE